FVVAGSARFRGDGAPIDLLLVDPGDFTTSLGSLAVARGNGDGTFSPPIPLGGSLPGNPVVGQFTPDGNLDVLVVFSTLPSGQGQLSLLRGNGDGTFQSAVQTPLPLGRNVDIRGAADLNDDGIPDLVVNVLASADNQVLLGNGDGTFRAPITFRSGTSNLRLA